MKNTYEVVPGEDLGGEGNEGGSSAVLGEDAGGGCREGEEG